jgi:hypothetical protein
MKARAYAWSTAQNVALDFESTPRLLALHDFSILRTVHVDAGAIVSK